MTGTAKALPVSFIGAQGHEEAGWDDAPEGKPRHLPRSAALSGRRHRPEVLLIHSTRVPLATTQSLSFTLMPAVEMLMLDERKPTIERMSSDDASGR
jgi:hypothetical protein